MVAYVGLITILITWLSGWWLLVRWRNKDFMSISRHAATSRQTIIVFAVVLIVFGALLYGWMYWWLGPRLGLGWLYRLVLVVAAMCQLLTAVVPDLEGWWRTVHKLVAWSMAVMFLPLAWLIATAANLAGLPRILCLALALYMTVGWVLILLRVIGKRFLVFQASYIVAIQLIILIAAYS